MKRTEGFSGRGGVCGSAGAPGALRRIIVPMLILCLFTACANTGSGSGSGSGGAAADYKPPASIGGIVTGDHEVIAVVNGENIYEDIFMEYYLHTMSLSAGLDMSVDQDEQVAGILEMYKEGYLKGFIEQRALLQEAGKENIEAADADVEEYLSRIAGEYGNEGLTFEDIQKMWGFNDVSIRAYIKDMMTIQLHYEEITNRITEPSQTPEEYYNAYPLLFKVDEKRTVRHILVAENGEAEEIVRSLINGADFGELVQEKSLDTYSKQNGGAIGPFDAAGQMDDGNTLVEPFVEASFALDHEGDFTRSPAQSAFGYHVIILDQIAPAHTTSFDEVRDELAYRMLIEAKDEYFNEYYDRIVGAAEIEYSGKFSYMNEE